MNTQKILSQYQCDHSRSIEENFAQMLTENNHVRLFFINEGQAFTDGRNIVVDPGINELYADRSALEKTEKYMKLKPRISTDAWLALQTLTRGQNIHESLHVIYSDFPTGAARDSRGTTKIRKKVLALISNIIEDAFVEGVGCEVFDNLEFFLQFQRLALVYSSTKSEGTVNRSLKNETMEKSGAAANGTPQDANQPTQTSGLIEYLNYMVTLLLYPMIEQSSPNQRIASYVEETKQFFLDGSICGRPKERYGYTQKIFDIIEPLIPEADEIDDMYFAKLLPGMGTHNGDNKTIGSFFSSGKSVQINRRLFTDAAGNKLPMQDFDRQVEDLANSFSFDKELALSILNQKDITTTWSGTQFDCARIHSGITITETKPKPNLNLRRAYQNIYRKYQININSYNSRFTQLFKARIPVREDKKLFGSGINSRRLHDTKKRFWYRNTQDLGVPDIAVLFLIDGSGSMSGSRRESAITSCVILHEVLKKQRIAHAIVEHRAIYGKPEVRHNILVDFSARDEDKFNILALKADEGTREGLSLFWAERYLSAKTYNEKKLMIVLSDGAPYHGGDDEYEYSSPVSEKDTKNAAAKIIRRGTEIIAIALDDDSEGESGCYDELAEIYPFTIACTNLKRLTGQILSLVSKNLFT